MRSSLLVPVFLGVLLAPAPAAHASSTLKIPSWAGLRLYPKKGLELGETATWVLELEALAGPVLASPPSLKAGPGVRLAAGPDPAESRLVRAGEVFRWTFRVTVDRPGQEPWLEAVVEASCPLGSLEARVKELYADASRESLRNLVDRIRGLPRRQSLLSRANPNLRVEEGVLAGQYPLYTRYLEARGGARFAVWDPPREKGSGAARDALRGASPRLRQMLLAAGVTPHGSDGGRGHYRELLDRVEDPEAWAATRTRLHSLMNAGSTSPEVRTASGNLAAVLAVLGGDPEAGERELRSLAGSGPDHYFDYNLGESLRLRGKFLEAARAYESALLARPVYSLARKRKQAVENR